MSRSTSPLAAGEDTDISEENEMHLNWSRIAFTGCFPTIAYNYLFLYYYYLFQLKDYFSLLNRTVVKHEPKIPSLLKI